MTPLPGSDGTPWSLNVIRGAARRAVTFCTRRRTFVPLAAMVILALAPGMRGRFFGVPDEAGERVSGVAAVSRSVAPPARLVPLEPGSRLKGDNAPEGWSHLVIKSIPMLSTGDLDTVSDQAFENARRVRPVIAAEVRRSSTALDSPYRLDRVGTGLCAPAVDPKTDLVVSGSSVEGTKGAWTAKQRLILTAMSMETSGARLAAATPTFALLRTPVTFLVSGVHQKIDVCYALLVEPRGGELQTLVWADLPAADKKVPVQTVARLVSSPVFDCPLDVKASKILGNIPVSWSFAIRELPPGFNLALPPDLNNLLSSMNEDASHSARIEQALIAFLKDAVPSASLAEGPR
jgi:hypothetical protein